MIFHSIMTVVLSISLFGSIAGHSYPLTPDEGMTPGDLCNQKDPDFRGYRYSQKIAYCERNVDWDKKRIIYQNYSVPLKCHRNYTIDHMIPLSIGGSNAMENLWPEHRSIKEQRLHFEEEIFDAVRSGKMTQQEAVEYVRRVKMNRLSVMAVDDGGC